MSSFDKSIESNEAIPDHLDDDQIVTPWKVESKSAINYMKLIDKFGCEPIDGNLIKRFEQVTKMKAHLWLRRGLFFSHRDLDKALTKYEAGEQVYLYTGRGPTSEAMHLGHMIPFMFTKFLQDAFDAILVIQMSDDEKFFFKDDELDYFNGLSYKNARDIIACGFNPEKTLIFSNLESVGGELYKNVVKIMRTTTGNQIRGIYGLDLNNNVGQLAWPCFQAAPAFSNSFSDIFGDEKHVYCLVPMAIDQDPYFRMARDFAGKKEKEGYIKPAVIHTKFLVALGGVNAKMSSTGSSPTIYMTDTPKEIKKKIMSHAYSGGQSTLELHREYGGDLETDVSYQYLCYFMDDDAKLEQIARDYRSGEMLSGDIKKIINDIVQDMVLNHQNQRVKVTNEVIQHFFNRNRQFDMSRSERESVELDSDYSGYGINFDLYFGLVPPVIPEDVKVQQEQVLEDTA